MYSFYTVCGLLAVLLVHGAQDSTTENNCVSDYQEFEKKTFLNNTQNRYKLYQVFYPQNGHSPYGVDVVYETLLPNKTVLNITFEDFECTTTKWRWISSPIFLFVRPRQLNILVLLTLNYFREWTTPSVTLKVPYPCPNSTFDYLTQMTSLVSDPTMKSIHSIYVMHDALYRYRFIDLENWLLCTNYRPFTRQCNTTSDTLYSNERAKTGLLSI